jgi:hypothetical protein
MASVGMDLGPVVGGDVVVSDLERFSQPGGDLVQGSSQISVRDAQLVNANPVESFRQSLKGPIATGPNLGEYAAHALDRHGVVHDMGSREQPARILGGTPQVNAGQCGRCEAGGHRVHDGTCMTTRAELSSVATRLDELLSRVTAIAEELLGPDREVVGPELYEVERTLRSAQRRLSRILDLEPS